MKELCLWAGYDQFQANYPALTSWPKVNLSLVPLIDVLFSSVQLFGFTSSRSVYYLVPPFWEHLRFLVRHVVMATFDAIFFLRSLYYIKRIEVIDFRLFRATELAFAIRPKDGVARQGRRGGFHCCCPKVCWNNFSVVVRVRGIL